MISKHKKEIILASVIVSMLIVSETLIFTQIQNTKIRNLVTLVVGSVLFATLSIYGIFYYLKRKNKIKEKVVQDSENKNGLINEIKTRDLGNMQNEVESSENVKNIDKDSKTPLHYAVESKDIATTQSLISNGADINACDLKGKTPLHYASMCYDSNKEISVEMMAVLIYANANVLIHSEDCVLWTDDINDSSMKFHQFVDYKIEEASKSNNCYMVNKLKTEYNNVEKIVSNTIRLWPSIMEAISSNDIISLKSLCNDNIDVNQCTKILHYCILQVKKCLWSQWQF